MLAITVLSASAILSISSCHASATEIKQVDKIMQYHSASSLTTAYTKATSIKRLSKLAEDDDLYGLFTANMQAKKEEQARLDAEKTKHDAEEAAKNEAAKNEAAKNEAAKKEAEQNASQSTNVVTTTTTESTTSNDTQSQASTQQSTSAQPSSKSDAIYQAALSQIGIYQDCTALVTNSLAAVGIQFHDWPAGYLSLGTTVSADQAVPGDLVYYQYSTYGVAHIAVYAGNGQAVHGGWLGNQTVLNSVYLPGGSPVFIRVN